MDRIDELLEKYLDEKIGGPKKKRKKMKGKALKKSRLYAKKNKKAIAKKAAKYRKKNKNKLAAAAKKRK
jgi:threonine aldolase